jgi:hypothetical protein
MRNLVPRWGLCFALLVAAGTSQAGRPMAVEDADVAEVGGGELQTWFGRPSRGDRVWTSELAVGVLEGVEVGFGVARNFSGPQTAGTVQLKLRLTPARDDGCQAGAVLARAQVRHTGQHESMLNGALSCQLAGGPVHLNLGGVRAQAGEQRMTWGAAKEFAFGALTAHLEVFGQQQAKPTWQFGLRHALTADWQIDGSLGRTDHTTLFSIGMRLGW